MDCITTGKKPRSDGYVMVYYKGWRARAHRLAWEKANGPIPKGMLVCHTCDNRACVNTAHMFLGTHADNNADMASKMRSTIGSRNPSAKLNEAQVSSLRGELLAPGVSQKELATKYGVSMSTISNIKNGKRWAHVEAGPPTVRMR